MDKLDTAAVERPGFSFARGATSCIFIKYAMMICDAAMLEKKCPPNRLRQNSPQAKNKQLTKNMQMMNRDATMLGKIALQTD